MSDSFDKTTGAVPGAGSMDTAQRRKALEQELAPKMEGETRDRGEATLHYGGDQAVESGLDARPSDRGAGATSSAGSGPAPQAEGLSPLEDWTPSPVSSFAATSIPSTDAAAPDVAPSALNLFLAPPGRMDVSEPDPINLFGEADRARPAAAFAAPPTVDSAPGEQDGDETPRRDTPDRDKEDGASSEEGEEDEQTDPGSDLDEAPTGLALTGTAVAENAPGAVIGTVAGTDPEGAPLAWSVDDPRFEVVGDTLKLKDGVALDHEAGGEVDLILTATDPAGNATPHAATLAVTDLDEAPTGLALTGTAVAENAPGAVIGTVAGTDPEGAPLAWSVDDPRFEVVGDTLKLKDGVALDHEAGGAVDLILTATDPAGNATPHAATLAVTDLDEAPTGLALTGTAVAENAPGAVIGTVAGTDPEGAALTWSVDDPRFEVVGDTLKLKDGVALDHEAGGAVDLILTATDPAGNATPHAAALAVTDLDEAPTGLALTGTAVAENAPGAVIGTVAGTDPEGAPLAWSVDDPRFEVVGDTLKLKDGVALDHEAGGEVDLILTATDPAGNATPHAATLAVTDLDEAPTGLALTGTAVAENAPGAVIGTVAGTDPEGAPLAWSVDDPRFEVVGDTLKLKDGVALDHEAGGAVDLILTATDPAGNATPHAATLAVTDLDEAPTGLALTGTAVAENAPGAVIGTVAGTDPEGAALTWTVDDPRFEVVGDTLKLKDGVSLDRDSIVEGLRGELWDADVSLGSIADAQAVISAGAAQAGFVATAIDYPQGATTHISNSASLADLLGGDAGSLTGTVPASIATTVYRFTGFLDLDPGTHSFRIGSDDGYLLLIDGVEVGRREANRGFAYDDWSLSVDGDHPATVELIWYENHGASGITALVDGVVMGGEGASFVDVDAGAEIDLALTATDPGGNATVLNRTVSVSDVDEAPTLLRAFDTAFEENDAGAQVATLHAADPEDQAVTWTVDDPRFEVVGDALKLKDGVALDHEAGPVTLTLTATDPAGNAATHSITLEADDVDEAPSGLSLTDPSVQENAAGAAVATVSATDPEGRALTWSVDDARFEIVGDTLKLKDGISLDHETEPTVALTLTATDPAGNAATQPFVVDVTDINETPVAQGESFEYQRLNEVGRVSGPNLLANDLDGDGDALRITHVDGQAIGEGGWVDLPLGRVYVRADGMMAFDEDHDFGHLAPGERAPVAFDYTVDDGRGGTDVATATLSVTGGLSPSFTNIPDSGLLVVDEGTTFVIDLAAQDPEGDVMQFAITGGADAAKFAIDPDTGVLRFKEAPELDGGSASGDNQYLVEVGVGGAHGAFETRLIQIDVDDKELLGRNLIVNGSFEDNGLGVLHAGTFDTVAGWTSTGLSPATLLETDIGHGQGDGDAIAHLTTGSAISQNVTVADDGTYRLTFNAFKHGYSHDNAVRLMVDGQAIGNVIPGGSGEEGFSVDLDLAAGAHDIRFESLSYSTTRSLALDNIELREVMASAPYDPATLTVIQAEDMTLQSYVRQDFEFAEGGAMLRVDKTNLTQDQNLSGSASTIFEGEAGDYVVAMRMIDENDGDGFIQLSVNGELVSTVSLNRGTGGDGWNDLSFRTVQISGVELNDGDVIEIYGVSESGDFDGARIDSLAFRPEVLEGSADNALTLTADRAEWTGEDAVAVNGLAEFDVALSGLEPGQTPRLTLTGLPENTIVLNGEMAVISDGGPLDLEGWDLTDLDIAPPAGFTGRIEAQLTAQADEGAPIASLDLTIEVAPAEEPEAEDPGAADAGGAGAGTDDGFDPVMADSGSSDPFGASENPTY